MNSETTKPVLTTQFDYDKIFSSIVFEKIMKIEIRDFTHKQQSGVYKRNALSALFDAGNLNPEFIKNEFLLIAEKQSKLPSSTRQAVDELVMFCIQKVIELVSKEMQSAEKRKSLPKTATEYLAQHAKLTKKYELSKIKPL